MATRGFVGRRPSNEVADRLPPGQYQTEDFPVLAKGPTPHVDRATWKFTISDGPKPLAGWTWTEFEALPQTSWRGDIHYVTNLPVADLVGGQAMVATRFGGALLEAQHGGPARLLVPHLYFWKSAKW